MMNVGINITNDKALLAKLRERFSDDDIYAYQVLQQCNLDEGKLPDSGDMIDPNEFFNNASGISYLIALKLKDIAEVDFRKFISPDNAVLYLRLINEEQIE